MMEKKTIGGLIVVVFAVLGMTAFYPYYVGSDRCQSGGVYGTWENVTEQIYFNDSFPAIARYYCGIETSMSQEECLYSNKLVNVPGCKWGGRTSKSKKTLYVIEDPELNLSVNSSDFNKSCEVIITPYTELQVVFSYNITEWGNGTIQNDSYISKYVNVLKNRTKETCKEYINLNGFVVEPELQYWNCSEVGSDIICDSCPDETGYSDGNCDGMCATNGGESCINITNGVAKYKNSVESWNEKSGSIHVNKLEVSR